MRDRFAMRKEIHQVTEFETLSKSRTIGRHIEDEYIIGEQLGSGMCGKEYKFIHIMY